MEAPGIEPGSESLRLRITTCVFRGLIETRSPPTDGMRMGRSWLVLVSLAQALGRPARIMAADPHLTGKR